MPRNLLQHQAGAPEPMANMLMGGAAEFSINCIHGEIFSVNMPGSVQKQINDMLTNSAVVYNTQ